MNVKLTKGLAAAAVSAAMMLGAAVPALAVTGTGSVPTKYTASGNTSPAESISYTVSNPRVVSGNATAAPTLTVTPAVYSKNDATKTNPQTKNVGLSFADTNTPGVYRYTLTPTYSTSSEGKTEAGVKTNSDELTVTYTVSYKKNADGTISDTLISAVSVRKGFVDDKNAGVKLDEQSPITISFDSGNLTVGKDVKGNLGDQQKEWTVKVKLNGEANKTYSTSAYAVTGDNDNPTAIAINEETTFHLRSGEHVLISDIPEGVTYTVSEAEANKDDYVTTYSFADETKTISKDDNDNATVVNTKDGKVDTGVLLNNAPYIAILGGAAVVTIYLVNKRRHSDMD